MCLCNRQGRNQKIDRNIKILNIMQITPIVKNLIIINIIVFFAIKFLLPAWEIYFQAYYPTSVYFKPVQIVTHMFMHGNLFPHLFFNMFMLWMFGTTLEYYWGSRFFLLVYLVSGLGAIFFHYFVDYLTLHYFIDAIDPRSMNDILAGGKNIADNVDNITGSVLKANSIINGSAVGASGAVFGIVAGFATQFPRRKLMLLFPPIPVEARILIPIIIILEIFLGLGQSDNIAHFAHVGGAICGFLLTSFRYKINI